MPLRILEKPDLGRLVSPRDNQFLPIHNWYAYKHAYSRELTAYLLKKFCISDGDWVLDPFCGGGTTLLTCKELGINARGYDILPFSVFLSNAKLLDYNVKALKQELNAFRRMRWSRYRPHEQLPDILLVKKAFSPEIGTELLALRHAIEQIGDNDVKTLFKLGFLDVLESTSNTSKAGGFLRMVNRNVSREAIRDKFIEKVSTMVEDVVNSESDYKRLKTHVTAKIGDARKLPTQRQYDAIITSPPYPNRHDYTRIYSLEMILGFVSTNDALKKVRYETLRSHVEARKKYRAPGYTKPRDLGRLISEVENNGTNNPQVTKMLEGYFEDMYLCLSEIQRCLKPGGKAAMVVSNVRFAGVNIPVDELLASIGIQVGLNPKAILIARYRGNSSQQMGLYKRSPSRESIVVWENSV